MQFVQILCACHFIVMPSMLLSHFHDNTDTHLCINHATHDSNKRVSHNNASFVTAITFSQDEKMVAIEETNGVVSLWDIEKNILIYSIKKHRKRVVGLAISQDSSMVVSAGGDHTVLLWNTLNGNLIDVHSMIGYDIKSINISTNNKYLLVKSYAHHFPERSAYYNPRDIVFSKNTLQYMVWDIKSGKLIYNKNNIDDNVYGKYNLHRDRKKVKVKHSSDIYNNEIILYKIESSIIATKPFFVILIGSDAVDDISNDGKVIVISKLHGIIDIWDTHKYLRIAHLKSDIEIITSMKLSNDSTKLAVCSDSSQIEIWDLSDIKKPSVKRFGQQKSHEIIDDNLKAIIYKTFTVNGDSFLTTIERKREKTEEGKSVVMWLKIQEFSTEELSTVNKLLDQSKNWISRAMLKTKQK